MKLKAGVKFGDATMAVVFSALVVNSIYQKRNIDLVITSVNDGKHMSGSLHYENKAFDVRSKDIPDSQTKKEILSEIKTSLGEDFDVLFEFPDGADEHFHIEYQPK